MATALSVVHLLQLLPVDQCPSVAVAIGTHSILLTTGNKSSFIIEFCDDGYTKVSPIESVAGY